MGHTLKEYTERLEVLAAEKGLDYYPVDFGAVPPNFMMEIEVYGLPIRMLHWSFGVRYIYHLIQRRMGHSRIFEVVYPGNPGHAYLADTNSLAENILVTAHVLGHADFSKNNALFKRSQEQVGYHIVEQAAAHAKYIDELVMRYGRVRVEQVLDAALALEQHIDMQKPLVRKKYPTEREKKGDPREENVFRERFEKLPGENPPKTENAEQKRLPTPPNPERDLLWFVANYGPETMDWEQDIFLMVREESFYFKPIFDCQIMNEGWASYWHARLMREADFLPNDIYVDAVRAHSAVVRPYAGEKEAALNLNPYHVGFALWEHIFKEYGEKDAFRVRANDDDFSFVRNYLTKDLADALKLFIYKEKEDGSIIVVDSDIGDIHEHILKKKYNFGCPRVYADRIHEDGSLELVHDHKTDGRGLDPNYAAHVLKYMHTLWRRPIVLQTIDDKKKTKTISCP
ncbi:SpoVR family protein [bacterium]|nr:SpoVR family protein [bacterium]MCI0566288.1 SpoVR family protein [bacterium]MCI0679918.1 SpoVR family protein [bacterium]